MMIVILKVCLQGVCEQALVSEQQPCQSPTPQLTISPKPIQDMTDFTSRGNHFSVLPTLSFSLASSLLMIRF